MNPWIGVLIQLGGILFTTGLTYGLLKGKLDNLIQYQLDTKVEIKTLTSGNMDSKIAEAKQLEVNKLVDSKIETIQDRLDIHEIGLRQAESDIQKLKFQAGLKVSPNEH